MGMVKINPKAIVVEGMELEFGLDVPLWPQLVWMFGNYGTMAHICRAYEIKANMLLNLQEEQVISKSTLNRALRELGRKLIQHLLSEKQRATKEVVEVKP